MANMWHLHWCSHVILGNSEAPSVPANWLLKSIPSMCFLFAITGLFSARLVALSGEAYVVIAKPLHGVFHNIWLLYWARTCMGRLVPQSNTVATWPISNKLTQDVVNNVQ